MGGRVDLADRWRGADIGEPEVAVRTGDDALRLAASIEAGGILRSRFRTGRGDDHDPRFGAPAGHPEFSFRTDRDAGQEAFFVQFAAVFFVFVLGDFARRRDHAYRRGKGGLRGPTGVGEP